MQNWGWTDLHFGGGEGKSGRIGGLEDWTFFIIRLGRYIDMRIQWIVIFVCDYDGL